jgi:hypothetical protein
MRLATGLTLLWVALASGSARAGAALDDDKKPVRTTDPTASPDSLTTAEDKVEFGVDIRLRSVYVPKALLELFVDRSADGAHNYGWGFDLVRRRGTVELQLGFEYEHVNVGEGVWINKGDNVAAGDEADWVQSPDHSGNNFGWFTFEFTFLNHAPINKYLAFRYGGGAGLGVIMGELDHFNVICSGATNASPDPGCRPNTLGGNGTDSDGLNFSKHVKYDMPPVFPVVNAIIGFQIKPIEKMVINIEGGIRTLPFIGTSVGYFF